LFLERDAPWCAAHRDLPRPPYGRTELYRDLDDLRDRFGAEIREADLALVGSYVPEGVLVGEWVTATARGMTAFYDIDTPVTLARVARGDCDYLNRAMIPRYELYLSVSGGPILERIERELGSPRALPLYCAFDPELYRPDPQPARWDLGYLGAYSDDRQPPLDRLMLGAARRWPEGRFAVVGPQYPESIRWPANVERILHLPPAEHCGFYNTQRFTLNITRADMIRAGYSPSVRLFEAAACGTPVISDYWDGLDSFFKIGSEILVSHSGLGTLEYLTDLSETERLAIGRRARERALEQHSAAARAQELERYVTGSASSSHTRAAA
ncbi:MAG: CgeB family protein, partial [Actinomycetota bacterium]